MSVATCVCQPRRAAASPSASAIAPPPDDHELRDRAEDRDGRVLGDHGVAGPSAQEPGCFLAGLPDRVGREQRRADDRVAVEVGDQADGLAGDQQVPQLSGQVGRRDQQATGVAATRQAGDQRVDVADMHVDETARAHAPAGQVGELGVERAADERTHPAAAGCDGEGVGSVAGAEPAGLDHPRHVHLGAGP